MSHRVDGTFMVSMFNMKRLELLFMNQSLKITIVSLIILWGKTFINFSRIKSIKPRYQAKIKSPIPSIGKIWRI